MKILSLDTSGSVASVAIQDENTILGEYSINHNKTHSQKLMPMINELLKCLEFEPLDIDIFSVAIGPGSFTGLRIGIATIKGMSQALNKPVIGIPTLDGLAYNVCNFSGYICPIIDARNDNVYCALYSFNNKLERHTDYMVLHINQLLKTLYNKKQVIFVGDGVLKFKNIIEKELKHSVFFATKQNLLQKASSIGLVAYNKALLKETKSYSDISPLYLRVSQAERIQASRDGSCLLGKA